MSEEHLKSLLNELAEMLTVSVKKFAKIDTACPYCGERLNATIDITDKDGPEAEASSICPNCFNIVHLEENFQLVKYTPETWQALGEAHQRFLREKQQEFIEKINDLEST